MSTCYSKKKEGELIWGSKRWWFCSVKS